MSFFSDILKKLKKPVDALKDFLTPKEKKTIESEEKPSPLQRIETKSPAFEYKTPSLGGVKSFVSSFIPPKEVFERKELAPREMPEERAARLAKAHETTKKIAEFGKAVLRAGPRAAASVTLEAQGRRTMVPETKAEKFLFGQEPLESITERIERFPERAKEFGIQEPTAKKIAPFAVLGLTALDILPPLPGKGVAKQTVKELAKKYGDDVAKQIIKKGSKELIEKALEVGGEAAVKKAGIAAKFIREFKYELPAHLMPAKGKPTWNIGKTLWNTMRSGNVQGQDLARNKGAMSWVIDRLSGGKTELGELLQKYAGAPSTNKQYRKLYAVLKSRNYNIEDYKKVMSELKGIEPMVIERKLVPDVSELKAAAQKTPTAVLKEAAESGVHSKKLEEGLSEAYYALDKAGKDEVYDLGKVRDYIADPKVREQYKDVLDTPLYVKRQVDMGKAHGSLSVDPKGNPAIVLSDGLTPDMIDRTLVEELTHAKQFQKGVRPMKGIPYKEIPEEMRAKKAAKHFAPKTTLEDVIEAGTPAKQATPAIPEELESFVPKAQKHKDVNSFIREIAEDTYAPEFRNPIADFWRKKYVQPLSKGSKATFTTDVVAFERNLDDLLNTKYTKEQLANMSVRQKAEIVNGKKWTDLYAEMLDNNLFKFQGDFFKAAKASVPTKPIEELKRILYHGTDLENVPKIQKGGFKTGGFLAHGYPQGVYFTTTKKEAQNYGKVIQATTKLNLSDFFDVSKHKELNKLSGPKYIQKLNQIIREAAESKGVAIPKPTAKQLKQYTGMIGELKDPLDISDIKTATLQKLGYKGFIAAEKGIGKEIVIFDPKDIVVGSKPTEALKAAAQKIPKEPQEWIAKWIDPLKGEKVEIPSLETQNYFNKFKPSQPVKLYRGVPKDYVSAERAGLESWTYDKSVAEGFAGEGGKILERTIKPEEIIIDFTKAPRGLTGEEFGKSAKEIKEVVIKPFQKVKAMRFSTPTTVNTDKFRGGTWYSTPESATYDFTKIKGVGGQVKTEKEIVTKNPLVLDNVNLEDGSFAVINEGFEDFLPAKERKLANELYERLHREGGIMDKFAGTDEYAMRVDELISDIGLKLGMKEKEIAELFIKNPNRFDALMDRIISQGLKKEGYDSLILTNVYKGKEIDRHIFKFAEKAAEVKKVSGAMMGKPGFAAFKDGESISPFFTTEQQAQKWLVGAEKATPTAELKEVLKTKIVPKLPKFETLPPGALPKTVRDVPEEVAQKLFPKSKFEEGTEVVLRDGSKTKQGIYTEEGASRIRKELEEKGFEIVGETKPESGYTAIVKDAKTGQFAEVCYRLPCPDAGYPDVMIYKNKSALLENLKDTDAEKSLIKSVQEYTPAEKAKPTIELKEMLKEKPITEKLPEIPKIKGAKAIDLSKPAKAAEPSKIQEIIGEYQKRISTTPAKKAATPIRKTFDDTYTAIIDRFHPITKLARKATDLRPGENPELLARRYLGVQGIAESKLFWNTTRLTAEGNLEVTGPGLSKILKPAKNNIDDLRTLMIAERDIELSKRTLESGKKVVGTTPQKSKEVINALKQKHGEAGFSQLSKTAQGAREWSRKALLDPLLEVGAISKEQYETITKSNEFYVPFQRVIEELETHGFVPKKASIFSPKSVPVKKLKGSTKDIIDPFESMITNAYKITDFAERARVGRSIANLRKMSPELAEIIKPIKPKIVPVAKQGEELIFRPSFFTPDKNTVMVFENGKRKFYQVPEDVFKAVSGMMESDVGAVMKVLAFPARTLRAGATLTPEFMGRNPFRDQFTAFVFSKYGYVPGVDLIKGIWNTVGKTDLHGRWLAGGGAHSMLVSLDRMTSQATLAKVLGSKDIKGLVKNPIEALRILSEFGEKGTRLGAFGRAVKKGVSDLEAAFESRDITLDFARRGSQTRAVNMIVAFWNAQIQGLNKLARAFRERPMQTTFKAASGITLPSVLLYLNNRNDPRYQELPQWQKDLFWILPIGDKGPIIRIPKPFEVGIIFGTVPEHILTWIDKNDPEALKSMAKTLMEASAPGYIPTGLQPIIENIANYSFFKQRPIVSEGKEALPKELQAGRYTSETAKEIGKIIKQSPSKIENLFVGYTGGLGQYALDASDKLLKTLGVVSPPPEPAKTLADRPFIKAFVAREPIGSGSESVNKFYKLYDEANATKAAVKGLAEEGKEQEAINYLQDHPAGFYTKGLNKVVRTFSDLRKKRDAILDSRDLNPEQKKRAVDALDKIMTEIARQTVELVESSNEKFRQ